MKEPTSPRADRGVCRRHRRQGTAVSFMVVDNLFTAPGVMWVRLCDVTTV
jgi:hypothetical protein